MPRKLSTNSMSSSGVNDRSIWDKWYPRNWQSDRGVRRCSGGARGLWIEIINLMIQSPKRGFLLDFTQTPAKAYTPENLSKDVELPVDEVVKWLAELKENGVYSVDRYGRIYCRRIMREHEKARIGKINGKLGGNPSLIDQSLSDKGLTHPLTPRPTLKRKKKEAIKERRGKSLFEGDLGSKSKPAQSRSGSPWTLQQKREFAHKKIADALGGDEDAWLMVMRAADGDQTATRICKAKAKEISVTWYRGTGK